MEKISKILAISRSTKQCNRLVKFGITLAKNFSAELIIVRVIHDPFHQHGWNLPIPSFEEEYKKVVRDANKELEKIVKKEAAKGNQIKEFVREGNPVDEVLSVISQEKINLMLLLAHEEGHFEHFLFGRSNEELVRKMPCSIFLLKSAPAPDAL